MRSLDEARRRLCCFLSARSPGNGSPALIRQQELFFLASVVPVNLPVPILCSSCVVPGGVLDRGALSVLGTGRVVGIVDFNWSVGDIDSQAVCA